MHSWSDALHLLFVMALHTNVDQIALSFTVDDEKSFDLNETDDSTGKIDLDDSIQSNLSDSGTDDDDSVYRFDKKSTSYGSARRFFNKSSSKTWKGNRKSVGDGVLKEFFTLQFDHDMHIEKVPAKKGKSLKESIEGLLVDRGLDFKTHSVFVESSKTPLPLQFDTFPLGGNILHVKENQSMQVDERIITLMKSADDDKRLQNQRLKKNIMANIFNEAEISPAVQKQQAIARKSGVSAGIATAITDVLNSYTFTLFDRETFDGNEDSVMDDDCLEESWTDVITEFPEMTIKDKLQQETIWELLTTEKNYLRKIRVILVFMNCLERVQKEKFLEDVDISKLFSNIRDVFFTNQKFWDDFLQTVTDKARQSKEPIKPSQLNESFSSFDELFKPYIQYCMEEGSCVKYLKKLKRENEHFQEYLAWCENHRQCMRLKLADLFVKPMQRITKYALILKAVLSKTEDENEKNALDIMISEVERFVTKINTALRLRNEQQKLDAILERIESYSPIEAANEEMEKLLELRYCNLDLRGSIPGLHEDEQRCILLDGAMKMIEKQGRIDVHTFLFTDLIVLAKVKKGSDKFRIIRQPFRLNKIMLHPSKDIGAFIIVYLNEYGVVVTAFTLQVTGSTDHTKWTTAINRAKKRYEDARAGKGSTLAFIEDDLPTSTFVTFSSNASPMPDRRSIASDDNRTLDALATTADDLTQSADGATILYQKSDVPVEPHVKRSFSDPKAGSNYSGRERSFSKQKGRQRPKSFVNLSDHHDIATWLLTNENRNQSGSLTSDVSDDSQRSSGIGDSFRSINSDGSVFPQNSELSKVAQLKARFESKGSNSPVNTDGSDSSVSTPSNLASVESTRTASGNRRISPHDYNDNSSTIKEEEEQSVNDIPRPISLVADTTKDAENGSNESVRTLNDIVRISNCSCDRSSKVAIISSQSTDTASQTDHSACELQSSTLQHSDSSYELCTDNLSFYKQESHCNCSKSEPFQKKSTEKLDPNSIPDERPSVNFSDMPSLSNFVHSDSGYLNTELLDTADLSICSEDYVENLIKSNAINPNISHEIINDLDTKDTNTALTNSNHSGNLPFIIQKKFINKSTQCEDELHTMQSSAIPKLEDCRNFKDVASQYDSNDITIDSTIKIDASKEETPKGGIKSGDDIGINDPKALNIYDKSLSDDGCSYGSKSKSPFMNMLIQSGTSNFSITRKVSWGEIRNSRSEDNIEIIMNRTGTGCHSRSRSDEPQQKSVPSSPKKMHRTNSTPREFPGMHALKILSESLENTIQKNLIKTVPNSTYPHIELNNKDLVRSNSTNSSSSLRKIAILKNSPMLGERDFDSSCPDGEIESLNNQDMFSGGAGFESPMCTNATSVNHDNIKRFTWHDFDSAEALSQVEEVKYGNSSTLPLSKAMSKSTEIIGSSKKSSLKRSIMRRFNDVLKRTDEPRSEELVDGIEEKQTKKVQKKERKRLRKEKRAKEREDKKRDSIVKGRSASVSSGTSRFNLPSLSASNSFGSHASSTNSK